MLCFEVTRCHQFWGEISIKVVLFPASVAHLHREDPAAHGGALRCQLLWFGILCTVIKQPGSSRHVLPWDNTLLGSIVRQEVEWVPPVTWETHLSRHCTSLGRPCHCTLTTSVISCTVIDCTMSNICLKHVQPCASCDNCVWLWRTNIYQVRGDRSMKCLGLGFFCFHWDMHDWQKLSWKGLELQSGTASTNPTSIMQESAHM